MAAVDSLHAHLVEELTDLRDAETQLTQALPKLAQSATSAQLRAAFQKHLKETRTHLTRIDQALRALGEKPSSETCEAMKGLLKEGEKHMKKAPAGALRDAVLITGAQKVEHYEMASYGTARTYAQVLGRQQVARLLEQTLKEEKAADRTLTEIAERSVNEDAAEEFQSQSESEEGPLMRSADWAGRTSGVAVRQLSRTARRAASAVGIAQERSSSQRSSSRRSNSQGNSGRRRRASTKKR
ncbi:MAG TPA: ferritin-like domain-containing protein [Vicinamibacterales bacterium]|nr:ferritin-like domain-containing protein [Vicinamibacterales bacterium]